MALTQISTNGIKDATIATADIADDAVTADKLANSINTEIAANTAKATNATHTGEVTGSGALTIANDAVTSAKIADNAVVTAAINADAVTGAKIADDAIGPEHIETLNGDVKFGDSGKAFFGAGDDLEIKHAGDHNYIWGNGANSGLTLGTNATSAFSIDTSQNVTINAGDLDLIDSKKIKLGAGDDLQIYHDGSDSYIKEAGVGELQIWSDTNLALRSDAFRLNNAANDENMIKADVNGAVELYYDNVKTLVTGGDGITVLGPEGGNATLRLSADEGDDNADLWKWQVKAAGGIQLENYASGSWEDNIVAYGNGAVELYHDNVKRLETVAGGVKTYGGSIEISAPEGADANLYMYADESDDNADNWLVQAHTTGFWGVKNYASGSWEKSIIAVGAGSVELYYDNSKKFETTGDGAKLTSGSHFDFHDSSYIRMGDGSDFQIYFDGSNSYIKGVGASCGSITIDNSADADQNINLLAGQDVYLKTHDGSHTSLRCERGGPVHLYWNNEKKFETESNGCKMHGGSSQCSMRMSSDGVVRGYLYVNNSADIGFLKADGNWAFRTNDGDYQFYGSNLSDRDRKDNITTVTGTSLDKITKLVPKTYNWKATDDGKTPTDRTFTGFIAQEVKEHLPSLVSGTDGQKNMAIDYNGILAHAIKAIQELSAEVETLKTKVT